MYVRQSDINLSLYEISGQITPYTYKFSRDIIFAVFALSSETIAKKIESLNFLKQ